MKLSEFKNHLLQLDNLSFSLENGTLVPPHFHITEVGCITKDFIDCGGTLRTEKHVNFQLWFEKDINHRLQPQKLLNIIKLSERKLQLQDYAIEVEYQSDTIGKYNLAYFEKKFILINKQTNCLASDKCGIPESLVMQSTSCNPQNGCC